MENNEIDKEVVESPTQIDETKSNNDIKTNDETALSETDIQNLEIASKWAKFISITGFIVIFFMLILGIIILFSSFSCNNFQDRFVRLNQIDRIGGILMIVGFAVLFPAFWILNSFSIRINKGIKNNTTACFGTAFKRIAQFFKYFGLLIVAVLVIYTLFLIIISVFSVTSF
ncbi:MAG: hypothetical protein PHP31_01670 [Lentimicrobiaceae bacterium]|nr:hypothetical protein [Lentimicrobiaceae bacterium]